MRQGCPLSPIIFTLLIEPLAESFQSHPNIIGLTIAGAEHKISLFMDYVMLMLSNTKTSVPEMQKLLEEFSAVSYYKLNTKSQILGERPNFYSSSLNKTVSFCLVPSLLDISRNSTDSTYLPAL